jgi:hypothetical protein
MDKTTLVESDFKDGTLLIEALDNVYFNVHSALWLYNPEEDNWRFIIASKVTDFSGPKKAYSQIKNVLKSLEKKQIKINFSLENISVISPHHPLINILGTAIKTGPNEINGIRLSRNRINNSYIEDAYIYRLQ